MGASTEELLRSKFLAKISARQKLENSIAKVFRYYDLKETGTCTYPEFSRALRDYSHGLPDAELGAVFRKYARPVGPALAVDYKEFAVALATGLPPQELAAFRPAPDLLACIRRELYTMGMPAVCQLARTLQSASLDSVRTVPLEDAADLLAEHFRGTSAALPEEQAALVLQAFEDSGHVFLDEFMQALREPLPDAARQLLRAAFRKLDPSNEGVVDFEDVLRHFNSSRHPAVADGKMTCEQVEGELQASLAEWVQFRRGQEDPSWMLSWEEFEDFFCATHPCIPDFVATFEKVWDLDKSAYEAKRTAGQPAAGIPVRARVGLHHWQPDTLPRTEAYRDACDTVDLHQAIGRLRGEIASKGITHAVNVVQTFVAMDDDMDSLIDLSEFRRACDVLGIRLLDSEEEVLFESMAPGGKLPVFGFLAVLHGKLSPAREAVVQAAFASLGQAQLAPTDLRAHFAPEAHPAVTHHHLEPEQVLREFLDTFSTVMRATGGCQTGQITYDDFLSYYIVFSSTIPHDSYFELLVRRLWGLEKLPAAAGAARGPAARLPHTQSSVLLQDGRATAVWPRLRATVAKRGLKGWRTMLTQAAALDKSKSGRFIKPDWVRFMRTNGLGLSPEEQEYVLQTFGADGYVDYDAVLALIRGEMSTSRAETVAACFASLTKHGSPVVPSSRLKQITIATHPSVVLGGASQKAVKQDWDESVDYFAPEMQGGAFTEASFHRFFSYVSATLLQDDEFRLLAEALPYDLLLA